MYLTRRPLAAVGAALFSLCLAAPAGAAPQANGALSGARDDQQLHHQLQATAEQARQQHEGALRQKRTPPGRATDASRAMDAGLAKVVADGAIGITARVETPSLDWSGAAGLRDKDGRAPAGRQDRFRVASNTKMMVATLVLQEVDRGVWRLDQKVSEVMPDLFPAHPDVTFRQLLSHTAGVPNGTNELLVSQMTDPSSPDELVAVVSRDYTPQQHIDLANGGQWTEPGHFAYSNAGYVALGMLLEHQNQRSLPELMRERIWRPLGLHHTDYLTEPGMRGPALHEDAWYVDRWLELDGFDPDVFGAAGAVVSTTDDLDTFSRALLRGELFSRSLLAQMMQPVTQERMQYGLGLYRIPDPCPVPGAQPWFYGHDGAAFGTLSVVFVSADGSRQFSLGATGRDLDEHPRWNLNDAALPMMLATC